MSEHAIEMTEKDVQRLRELLACHRVRPGTGPDARALLRHKLDHAHVVSPSHLDRRVVTLQSCAVVEDDETWESRTYTLVHPADADDNDSSLSVLTLMSAAILGHREGDVVEWGVPPDRCRIRIRKVLDQPETAGQELLKYRGRRRDNAYRVPRGHGIPTSRHPNTRSSVGERSASWAPRCPSTPSLPLSWPRERIG